MGFHVFYGVDDEKAKWKRHTNMPVLLRILDHTAFKKSESAGVILMTSFVTTVTAFVLF
jgi:hypothetical protein